MLAVVAESLDAVVIPDEPSSVELALLEQLSLADAETQAALVTIRELVRLVRRQGGHLFQDQQDIVTAAQQTLDDHGVDWRTK